MVQDHETGNSNLDTEKLTSVNFSLPKFLLSNTNKIPGILLSSTDITPESLLVNVNLQVTGNKLTFVNYSKGLERALDLLVNVNLQVSWNMLVNVNLPEDLDRALALKSSTRSVKADLEIFREKGYAKIPLMRFCQFQKYIMGVFLAKNIFSFFFCLILFYGFCQKLFFLLEN